LGDEYYDELSMVTKVTSLTTLSDVISNAISNFKFNNKELNALMQVVNEQTISVPYFSIIKDGVVLSAIQRNGSDFNLTIKHYQKFFDAHKNYFELIAQTIYSKL
jgi:cellulose biosynthesis protein BcsQ